MGRATLLNGSLRFPGARLLAVRGFLFLVLQELRSPSGPGNLASSSHAGPCSSSQVLRAAPLSAL